MSSLSRNDKIIPLGFWSAFISRIRTHVCRSASLLVLLAAATASAQAEWQKVGETDTQVIYFEAASVLRTGQLRRVTLMHDLKQRGPSGELSKRTVEEHDCVGNRVRGVSGSTHAGPILGGRTLWSGGLTSEWHQIPIGSGAATMHKFICG